MSIVPDDLRYLDSHEWVRVETDSTMTIGISEFAQEQLGDLVYVELPEVGRNLEVKDEAAVVESVKAASDVYSPVAGTVIEINGKLIDAPELVNTDPYGEGWLFKLKSDELNDMVGLLDPERYRSYIVSND